LGRFEPRFEVVRNRSNEFERVRTNSGSFELESNWEGLICKVAARDTESSNRTVLVRTKFERGSNVFEPVRTPVRTSSKRNSNRHARNGRKRAILAALEPGGWLTPGVIAALVGMSGRNVYWPLKRYWRWGLLRRRQDRRGRLLYSLSDRGRERLRWLRRRRGR
jgi:DNA-binding transcriptional ArsR family regulator